MFTIAAKRAVATLHSTACPFSTVAGIAAGFRKGDPDYSVIPETVEYFNETVKYLKSNPTLIPGYAIYPIELLLKPNEKRYIEDLQNHLAKCYAKLEGFVLEDISDEPIFLWAFDALRGLKALLEEKDARAEPYKREANKILQENYSRFKALPDEGEFLKLKVQVRELLEKFQNIPKKESEYSPLI